MTPEEVKRYEVADRFKMPWGKYRYKRLEDIPSSYLIWVAENVKDNTVCTMCDLVWRWREENGEHFEEEDIS